MKKSLLSLIAAVALVPTIAFAGSVTIREETTVDSSGYSSDSSEYISEPGYVETTTSTRTTTTHRNARSDTEYLADRPNPGSKTVETEVRETVEYR